MFEFQSYKIIISIDTWSVVIKSLIFQANHCYWVFPRIFEFQSYKIIIYVDTWSMAMKSVISQANHCY